MTVLLNNFKGKHDKRFGTVTYTYRVWFSKGFGKPTCALAQKVIGNSRSWYIRIKT